VFRDADLESYLKTNNTIKTRSLIIGEWNMNDLGNIASYGNYRYRPYGSEAQYRNLPVSFDKDDFGDYYTNADDSTLLSTELFDNEGNAFVFRSNDENRKLYSSLRQCFEPFRPRSGINKCLYITNKFIDNIKSGRRPRYYLASREDTFKYWSSFRKEVINDPPEPKDRGISSETDITNQRGYDIEDAAPFVIYKEAIPANRIVIKIQTNLGEDETTIANMRVSDNSVIIDPLLDRSKSSIPKRWSIDYLDINDQWINAGSFNETSIRRTASAAIIPWDGYFEFYYGLKIPDQYKVSFNFIDYLSTEVLLPDSSYEGDSYIVGASLTNPGILRIWNTEDQEWKSYDVEYGFFLSETDDTKKLGIIKSLVDPDYFAINEDGPVVYRDIALIKGLRLAAQTMHGPSTTLDLIEMSPRLRVDMTKYIESFEINKEMYNSDMNIPVGGLIASNGTLNIFNYDGSFTESNVFDGLTGSLIANKLEPNVKFDIYDIVAEVPSSASVIYDKIVPLKTLYAEDIPNASNNQDISITLRDFFFRLETMRSPAMFYTNVSVTAAVAMLLDNIGFSNYVYIGVPTGIEPIIPYLFVEPETSVAEVLSNIALATQTSMFFDEYNNFVVMFKEYLLPEGEQSGGRSTDIILQGNTSASVISNIESIDSEDSLVLNDGVINYTTRYIQRSSSSLEQEFYLNEDQTYSYKPVLLWEVSADDNLRDINEVSQASAFGLTAVPLNTYLSASVPYVENGVIRNSIIDVGENIYWVPRFRGYLYANGEIIRYEGVEFSITGVGNRYLTTGEEFQKYASTLKFNGTIFPTGNIKIYTEPYYEEIFVNSASPTIILKNGQLKLHGRGQFGTSVVEHYAGLSPYWSPSDNGVTGTTAITFYNGTTLISLNVNDPYMRGCKMISEKIFSNVLTENIEYKQNPSDQNPAFGSINLGVGTSVGGTEIWSHTVAGTSSITGIIKNFMRRSTFSESPASTSNSESSVQKGMIQSSALVLTGPTPMPGTISKRDFITYKYKYLFNDFSHFGTRMRIIGVPKTNDSSQAPINGTTYFSITGSNNDVTSIDGGSGGMGIFINEQKNHGYFFEICALTKDQLESFTIKNSAGVVTSVLHNIIFYKTVPNFYGECVPVKLWGGITQIIVDEGNFVGQDRVSAEENPTVYDLAIEYEKEGTSNIFYLFLNGQQIAKVEDNGFKGSPIIQPNNTVCLFVRGSSKCMFENIYALKRNTSKESKFVIANDIKSSFGITEATSFDLRKYALSGLINSTYLTGISAGTSPKYNIYFEEFGTIMRECYYFDIKYDQAYPALLATLAPVINKERGYTTSGFYAGSYGSRFLIFNATDKFINLDDTSGNYLRILGVTFTQNTTRSLTVDDFFNEISDFSNPFRFQDNTLYSPERGQKIFDDVKLSRFKYGKREFSLESPYLQSSDTARNIMGWIINKALRKRKLIEMNVFGLPHVQLGDIAQVDYILSDGNRYVDETKRFLIYGISHSKSFDDYTTTLRLVET